MNFIDYKKSIANEAYTESLNYKPAIMWISQRLPLCVTKTENAEGIIKVPDQATNDHGGMVTVIAIDKDAFSNNDKVTDIILPSSIESVAAGAFADVQILKG